MTSGTVLQESSYDVLKHSTIIFFPDFCGLIYDDAFYEIG